MAPKKAGSDHDGASPGKIFVGGLSKDTSLATFYEHFAHYGAITDHVIMKDRDTHRPRGFGFITYADPAVVDKVMEETHVINDKQVEIKRTIPKSSAPSRDIKTKKIFVGGIPASVNEDELKNFFTKYGKVVDQEILRDHTTKRSRGFGFVIFDSEHVVDELLAKGNKIDFAGSQGFYPDLNHPPWEYLHILLGLAFILSFLPLDSHLCLVRLSTDHKLLRCVAHEVLSLTDLQSMRCDLSMRFLRWGWILPAASISHELGLTPLCIFCDFFMLPNVFSIGAGNRSYVYIEA